MGFWHTGYAEFHEEVGLGDIQVTDTPVHRFCCDQCEAVFDSLEKLRTHRFEKHPIDRPCLLIRGVEVNAQPLVINTPLSPSDVTVLSTKDVVLNGQSLASSSLGEHLSRFPSGTARIVLSGDLSQTPRMLHFKIATANDLAGVEQAFMSTAADGRLDRRAIEQFISAAKQFPTAEEYCNGICEYLYGVLAKERFSAVDVPYDRYRDKLNSSRKILHDLHRPLARQILGLIDFNFNLMRSVIHRDLTSRVGFAAERLRAWGNGDLAPAPRSATQQTGIDRALTDADTEAIIAWACQDLNDLVRSVNELDEFSHKPLAEFDKSKCHIMLGALRFHMGDIEAARRHARELYHMENPQLSGRRLVKLIEERTV